MTFAEAVRKGIEIVKLDREAMRTTAADPEAFTPALAITALVGIASWLCPVGFHGLGFILHPLMALAALFIGVAVLHFVATLFGGRGEYLPFVRAWGVGSVIGWASIIPFIGWIIGLWRLVITVVMVEELYGLDRTKAILTVLIPAVVMMLFWFSVVMNLALFAGVFRLF